MALFVGSSIQLPLDGNTFISHILTIWVTLLVGLNLVACAMVIHVGSQIQGTWFALMCGVLAALLGCTLGIGYFLIPSLMQSALNRQFGTY